MGGPRRVHPPGLAFGALPPVHLVLLSHNHYDHGDESTLRRLAAQPAPLFVAPLRPRALLAGCGARRIVELDWWQSHVIAPAFSVTLTPARHWSNRLGTPRNHRLWGGFSLSLGAPAHRLWFAGDTGYDEELFRSIGHRAGAPRPRARAHRRLRTALVHGPDAPESRRSGALPSGHGARRSLALHWGTFQLTDEGRDDPVHALTAARTAAGLADKAFEGVAPGATVTV